MTGSTTMSFKQLSKLMSSLQLYRIKCKCGHTMHLVKRDRAICDWCNHWVYKNKFIEMKYELEKRGIKYGRR